jgi:hypothetical protein
MKYIHEGEDRPLIYLSNFGEIYLKKGDIITQEKDYIYHSRIFNYPEYHRYLCYIDNLVCIFEYGLNQNKTDILFTKILREHNKTPLERDIEHIEQIYTNLPNKDITISHYQFTNNYRPCTELEYKEGLYINKRYTDLVYTKKQLAWHIYRNMFKLLPNNEKECSAEKWKSLPYLYDHSMYEKALI